MIGSTARMLGAALLGAALAGPVTAQRVRDRVDLIESDVRDLQSRVAELLEANRRLEEQVRELRAVLGLDGGASATPADLAARLDALDRDVRVLAENHRETAGRLAVATDKLDAVFRNQAVLAGRLEGAGLPPGMPPDGAAPPPDAGTAGADPGVAAPGAAPPPAGQPLVDPQELYDAARADYGRGSYQMAIAGFEEFAATFPASDLVDNALYWIGECHHAQGQHAEALALFTRVLEEHPESEKVPDAAYKRGTCLLELGRQADGILQLKRVRDAYPDTAAARLSRQKLQALGLDPSGEW